MCNSAQSRPRKWAVAMGSTLSPSAPALEVLSALPSRASIPSLGQWPVIRGAGL